MIDFGNNFGYLSNKNLRKELKLCDETIDKLTKKCEILEENNKLLIQQKAQMYEDLDIAYKRIDKAIEYIKLNIRDIDYDTEEYDYLMNILEGKDE